MTLSVVSNYAANVAHNNLMQSQSAAAEFIAQLSSGSRIVQASDDAASLAIGDKLNAEVSALNQASVNAGQATSVLQIADGAYSQINNILTRMQTLAVQASSGQLSGTQRAQLNTEYTSLTAEIDRISNVTDFNGTQLINGAFTITGAPAASAGVSGIAFRGTFSSGTSNVGTLSYSTTGDVFSLAQGGTTYTGAIAASALTNGTLNSGTVVTLTSSASSNTIDISLNQAFAANATQASSSITLTGTNTTSFSFQIGAGTTTNDQITVSVNGSTSTALGINGTDISTESDAQSANTLVGNAINQLQNFRANIGANESRLNFATSNLATATQNLESAKSSLMDVDVAQATTNLTSKQILVQLGVAELAQANQLPQFLLKLVG
ncbi:MAG TPA: flagellin [Alphaproteobacteria bacterium]|nr:flagellin [Alphaproteobacteria bacterium]